MPIQHQKNPWKPTGTGRGNISKSSVPISTATSTVNPTKKFLDARHKHQESARKYVIDYESSSDEENTANNTVLDSVFRSYSGATTDLKKTQQFLENVFHSGAATCLICIASIKRADPIWSCEYCYSFFHLPCIQRWANDSTAILRLNQELESGYYNNLGEYIVKETKVVKWNCPNCRHDYNVAEIPRYYTCFCKNETDPQYQPWLVPHSCGETCKKYLQPECGHRCLLLCHPGPCPPCPQMITTSCCCGQSKPKAVRCSQKLWKCLNKCKLKLKCGIHTCGLQCHSSADCPSCTKRSKQTCLCGSQIQERSCNELVWQCEKICDKLLDCGLHKCMLTCHADECGDCPLGRPRECPCGKEKTQAPCSEEIGPCGDTCQKLLSCGQHICMQRCHKSECSQCLEITRKQCRCGNVFKELPCSKRFLCEIKCKQMRDCNKHPCNRKCCDGNCPPCDKICGKTLSCGKHKCTSLCHHGLCYPCTEKCAVKCRCGSTVIQVPCGRERKTKPRKCFQPCKIPSKCHHTNPHRCHQNDCPNCVQICALKNTTTGCEHLCQAQCHDSVAVSIKDKHFKPAGPWDVQQEIIEIQKLPHPECTIDVPVTCLGGHETVNYPCWNSKSRSCGRLCSRKLKCGNHICEEQCHNVADINSKEEDESCTSCTNGCSFPRPTGCFHKCTKPCHSDPCAPCEIPDKIKCFCGITQVHFKCGDFYKSDETDEHRKIKESMQSCGNQCIKNYACGHRCISVCHMGQCLLGDSCKKKVKIYCDCKTRKMTVGCDKIRAGFVLVCDDVCIERKEKLRMEIEEIEKRQREMEEEKNRMELLDFEKKFGKKKYKERKRTVIEEKDSNLMKILIGVGMLITSLSIAIYFLINMD